MTTQISVNWSIEKENVAYPNNGLRFSNKNGQSAHSRNMGKHWKHYAKQNNPVPQKPIYCMNLYKNSRIGKLIGKEVGCGFLGLGKWWVEINVNIFLEVNQKF